MGEEEPGDVSAVSSLLRSALAWNYYEENPGAEGNAEAFRELKDIPQTFRDVKEYIEAFQPLMLEECAALLFKGSEESDQGSPEPCVTGPIIESGDFFTANVMISRVARRKFSIGDIVLVTKDNPESEELRVELSALALLEENVFRTDTGDLLVLRFCLKADNCKFNSAEYKRGYVQEDIAKGRSWPEQKHEFCRRQAMESALKSVGTGLYVTPLATLATLLREWAALVSVSKTNFADILINAKPRAAPRTLKRASPAMEEELAKMYNASQLQAMQSGLSSQELILIQGPPGTGKTRTLLGLLSIILHSAPEGSSHSWRKPDPVNTHSLTEQDRHRLWLKSAPWIAGIPNARDEVKPWEDGNVADAFGLLEVSKPVLITGDSTPDARILICTPSNSALDEIVLRLVKNGIMDRKGKMYHPNIVRAGLSVHHSVKNVSLEALTEQKLLKHAGKKEVRAGSGQRDRVQRAVLEEAHIVLATLAFSGSPLMRRLSKPFDVVIVDEAAQAVEPSVLIPLSSGARQVFLIGDPVQLPATVISMKAINHKYDVSLFKRLQMAGYPVHMLDTQYRMHPQISAYPSQEFYHGSLKDGPGVASSSVRPWHAHKCLGPLAFYDVRGSEETGPRSRSLINNRECEMVLAIYSALVTRYPQLRTPSSVGVISPYKSQVRLLVNLFQEALGEESTKLVDINTIDGFQGREKEVVLFSAVRSRGKGGIGFVADERRINVGLTRARCSLLVVGNAKALEQEHRWSSLIQLAKADGSLYRPSRPFNDYLDQLISGKIEASSTEAAKQELTISGDGFDKLEDEGLPSLVDSEDYVPARVGRPATKKNSTNLSESPSAKRLKTSSN